MPREQKKLTLYFLPVLVLLLVSMSCTQDKQIVTTKDLTKTNKLLAIGHEFYLKQEFDSSFYYYNRAKEEAEIVQDTSRIIHSLGWMAEIQTNQGDYTGSESTCTEALPYVGTKGKFPYGETNIYVRLGNNYSSIKEYSNAIFSFKKAINSKTDIIDRENIENNIALALLASKNYNTALDILNRILSRKGVLNDKKRYSMLLNNVGLCLQKTGKKNALSYYYKSLEIKKQINDKNGILDSYYNLSNYYKTIDRSKSYIYAQLAYSLSTNVDTKLEVLKLLIQNSKGNALKKHSTLYIKINDSIVAVRQKSKNSFAKIKYDSTKEKEENKRLKQQKVENLLQLEVQKYKTYGMGLLVVIILIVTTYIYIYLTRKNRKEKIQVSYMTELQIAKKLHDELANDVYQMIKFVEHEDLSSVKNKEAMLQNLDTIYNLTRNISIENSNINTGVQFNQQLKDMLFGFNTTSTNVIINNIDAIAWATLADEYKITVYRVLQELLVNMKKHSNCSLAVVSFANDEKTIIIKYADNGIGANLVNAPTKNGLHNIENRLRALKGSITFTTELNKGFKADIILPV